MALRDHLNLATVTVTRTTTTIDAYGDPVATSTSTIIPRAAIWSPTQGQMRLSDKIAKESTHILAIEASAYTFTDADKTVVYGGQTYKIVGHPDNVAMRGVMTLQGLERIT